MGRFNQQTFQEWRDHPLTAVYLQYLRDQQAALAGSWARGNQMAQEAQSEAFLLGKMAALDWSEYADFYEIEDTGQDP